MNNRKGQKIMVDERKIKRWYEEIRGRNIIFDAENDKLAKLIDRFVKGNKWLYFDNDKIECKLLPLNKMKEIFEKLVFSKEETTIDNFEDFLAYETVFFLKMGKYEENQIVDIVKKKLSSIDQG